MNNIKNKKNSELIFETKLSYYFLIAGFVLDSIISLIMYYNNIGMLFILSFFFEILIISFILQCFMTVIKFYKSYMSIRYPTCIIKKEIIIHYENIISIKTSKGMYSRGDLKIKYYYKNRIKNKYLHLNLSHKYFPIINIICDKIEKKKYLNSM